MRISDWSSDVCSSDLAGETGIEAAAQFQQRGDAAVDAARALARGQRAGQHLQQGRLARAVAADDAHGLALPHLQVDPAPRPELAVVAPPVAHHSTAGRHGGEECAATGRYRWWP